MKYKHFKQALLFKVGSVIKEFKWKFPSYEKNLIPKDGELIEWLSIMQHFGAPTRLLDFS